MANFDLVFPHATHYEQWLAEQGYPYPAMRQGNRLPTKGDVAWALASYPALEVEAKWSTDDMLTVVERGKTGSVLSIEWNDYGTQPGREFLTMRGEYLWEVTLLVKLCERCSQLVLYPDTGFPAVILDSGSDAHRVDTLWQEACCRPDSWSYLHELLYG